ncbi:MAG: DUF4199 domain-containing protein [Chitinophagaceae bacterium]
MEQEKIMTHITKGLIIGLIGIIIGVAGYLSHLDQQSWFKWLSVVITCGGIIWACIYYAQQMDGRVTFGNIFYHGFKTTLIITILSLVWVILAFTVLFPDMKEHALEISRKQMEDGGKMTPDQIDQSMAFVQKSFMLFVILGVIFGSLIAGVIASLIGAGVAKKKPVNPLDQLSS